MMTVIFSGKNYFLLGLNIKKAIFKSQKLKIEASILQYYFRLRT